MEKAKTSLVEVIHVEQHLTFEIETSRVSDQSKQEVICF
jgi:hypothetical protein